MKAAVLREINTYPSIENFNLGREGKQVTIDLMASALNHRDLWITKGKYAGIVLPVILGSDGVGMYEGNRVIINPGLNWGDDERHQSKSFKVLGLPDHGTFAEKVSISPEYLFPAPEHLTNYECAALPLAGVTAYRAVVQKGQVKEGDKVLITGIGGGVALMTLQVAKALGAEVYITSGSSDKIEKAIAAGACFGVNYNNDNWSEQLKAEAKSFDVIIDSAGGNGFSKLMFLSSAGGRVVLYGGTAGHWNNISPQIVFWKQITILGTTMGSQNDFSGMLNFVTNHKIKPLIDEVFPLDKIDLAFTKMDRAEQFGKLVLSH